MIEKLCIPVNGYSIQTDDLKTTTASIYDDKELSRADVFLLGYCEDRNSDNIGASKATIAIRSCLYALNKTSQSLNIIDLGDCKKEEQIAQSYENLRICIKELSKYNKPILIFGGTQEVVRYIVAECNGDIAFPSISIVDAQIDATIGSKDFSNKNYLPYIQQEFPQTRLCHIASQEYLSNRDSINWWKTNNYGFLRLGDCNADIKQSEPLLRDSQLISIDMNAIRYSDNPAGRNVNGLYAEGACQIAWNSGYSPRMNTFFLSEYNPTKDIDNISAQLSAQILWHVLDGISQRKHESGDFFDGSYERKNLKHSSFPSDICFYRSKNSQTLWVEVPIGTSNKKRIIPCSEKDFEQFCAGTLPTIWLTELQRLADF